MTSRNLTLVVETKAELGTEKPSALPREASRPARSGPGPGERATLGGRAGTLRATGDAGLGLQGPGQAGGWAPARTAER